MKNLLDKQVLSAAKSQRAGGARPVSDSFRPTREYRDNRTNLSAHLLVSCKSVYLPHIVLFLCCMQPNSKQWKDRILEGNLRMFSTRLYRLHQELKRKLEVALLLTLNRFFIIFLIFRFTLVRTQIIWHLLCNEVNQSNLHRTKVNFRQKLAW